MDVEQHPSTDRARVAGPTTAPADPWLRAGSPLYWLFVLLVGGYLGLNASIGMRGRGIDWWEPWVWELSSALVIGVLVPLVVALERRVPVDSRPRSGALLLHAAGLLAFSLLHVLGILALRKAVYAVAGRSYHWDSLPLQFAYELQKDALLYAFVLAVCFLVRTWRAKVARERQALELARDLADARLAELTAQLEPHFLFNVLNAISNRMHEDVESADRMMARLGDLLRRTVDQGKSTTASLGDELLWLEAYLELMQERFRGQLETRLAVAPGLEQVTVPRLLLQPLVENALKHGLVAGTGRLDVNIGRDGDRLRCEVVDNGRGGAVGAQHGTGLANVARRLELLFPGDHVFSIEDRAGGGTRVIVDFPIRAR